MPISMKCRHCGMVCTTDSLYCEACGFYMEPAEQAKLALPDNSEIALSQTPRWIGRLDFYKSLPGELPRYISRKHLIIAFEKGKYFIEDQSSRHGTQLNGVAIGGHGKFELRDGDIIEIAGVLTVVFRISEN